MFEEVPSKKKGLMSPQERQLIEEIEKIRAEVRMKRGRRVRATTRTLKGVFISLIRIGQFAWRSDRG